jgi:ferredoxin
MKYLANVSSLRIDSEKCDGCGICLTVCPHAALAVNNRKATIRDLDACMECGACAKNCPAGAVTVQAGVGCAYAILRGMIGGTNPDCGCGSGQAEC